MRRFFFAATLAWLSAQGPQTNADTTSVATQLPDSIVVTANRFGQSPQQAIWPTTVLSRQAMSTDISLQQSLDGRFGLDLRQTSGVGSITTLSNWGTFNRHMLLLYNGRVVRDYSLGGFNLSDFSGDEFERVELLKGPQSAFYGADAIGGVVNLISRSVLVDRLDLTTRIGGYDLRQYRISASKLLGTVGVGGFAEFGEAENNRPNAGTDHLVLGLRGDYLSRNGHHRFTLSGRYFSDSLGAPGPVPTPGDLHVYGSDEATSLTDRQQDENYSVDCSYRFAPTNQGQLQVDLFWEKKNLDYHSLYNYQYDYYTPDGADSVRNIDSVDVFSRSIYNKRSAGASVRYQQSLSTATLAAGIDYLSGSLRATADDQSYDYNTVGPYAPSAYQYGSYTFWSRSQDQFDFWSSAVVGLAERLNSDISGRLQFVRGRKTQPSANLGLMYAVSSALRLKAGYGYAFRLPSIADQFADETYVQGNANLDPETSHSVVGTLEYEPPAGAGVFRLTAFSQLVKSLIQYAYDPNIYRSVPHNVNRFRSRGIDLSLSWRPLSQQQLSWGVVWQSAEQTVASGEYVDAYYVPKIKWRADWSGQLVKRLTTGLSLSYTSERSIVLYGGVGKTIKAVHELGASLTYAVSKQARLSLTALDLTDQRRPDQFGFELSDGDYPTPGRRLVAQLEVSLF